MLILLFDGFSGNVALKTAEGVAGLFALMLRRTLRHLGYQGGYLFARSALKLFRAKMDPRRYNAPCLLMYTEIPRRHGCTRFF